MYSLPDLEPVVPCPVLTVASWPAYRFLKRQVRWSIQSILKEIRLGCSLEGLMLKLKLQYFGHLMQIVDSLEKTLMLEGIGGRSRGDNRGSNGGKASPTGWTWVWVNSGSLWWTGRPCVLPFLGSQRVGHDWATELNLFWNLIFPDFKIYVKIIQEDLLYKVSENFLLNDPAV